MSSLLLACLAGKSASCPYNGEHRVALTGRASYDARLLSRLNSLIWRYFHGFFGSNV
jgi:hypothetical protein